MKRHSAMSSARRVRGAALLIAMALLVLVSTLAAGMVWQQHRAIQVEAAERSRTQSAWILNGALDWARLILREDARSGAVTALSEPWATPLAEARLSTFLAADKDNNAEGGPDAFLSGVITDMQSRYNLRNLIEADKIMPDEFLALQKLCEAANAPSDTATRIAEGLRLVWSAGGTQTGAVPIEPRTVAQLAWFGVDPAVLERLEAFVVLLPVRTPLNINTADVEVIAAVVPGLDMGAAQALVQARQRTAFKNIALANQLLGGGQPSKLNSKNVSVTSSYFEVRGKLRLDDRTLEERSIVERRGLDVNTIQRERVSSVLMDR
jgi:general secretion pathway protein K